MSFAELIAHLPASWPAVGGLVTILAYMVWRDRRVGEQRARTDRQVRDVHEQTVNDHPQQPNMRHQMDGMDAKLDTVLQRMTAQERDTSAMRVDVSGIRHDLHDEIDRSKSADKQIANELRDERRRSIIADAELSSRIDACHEGDCG